MTYPTTERPYTGPPPSWYDEPDETEPYEPDEDLIRDTYGDYSKPSGA